MPDGMVGPYTTGEEADDHRRGMLRWFLEVFNRELEEEEEAELEVERRRQRLARELADIEEAEAAWKRNKDDEEE